MSDQATQEQVATAAVLSPGVTAQVIQASDGTVVLHLAVDRRNADPKTVLLSSAETQVLMNMLLQFASAQAQAAADAEQNTAESAEG